MADVVTCKVSMLLPARGRPRNLAQSVASVFELAREPDSVEVLVRLDNDDPHLRSELEILSKHPLTRVRVFQGSRVGYSKMHEMYNGLAARARGEWLFIWNDDIQFSLTQQDWDARLCEAPLFSVQFPRRDITKTTDYTLPVVGRPIYEALGHLSMNAYCDAWISDFSAFAGTSIIRDDIEFVHHRLDDQTLREQNDGGREWHKFKAAEQMTMRRADMEAVIKAPGWASRHDGWDVEVAEHVNVDYINLCSGEARARAYRLKGRK